MKIYLAGPMRGYSQFNFPAFDAAAEKLRAEGHEVFSPAERDRKKYGDNCAANNATGDEKQFEKEFGGTIRECLGVDLAWICAEAEAIALLPGWENSKGARAEAATAYALGLQVCNVE